MEFATGKVEKVSGVLPKDKILIKAVVLAGSLGHSGRVMLYDTLVSSTKNRNDYKIASTIIFCLDFLVFIDGRGQ